MGTPVTAVKEAKGGPTSSSAFPSTSSFRGFIMKGVMFNIDNGYLEGLCRGFKNGVLSQNDYLNLVQCETLEDLKLHLQSTDYGNFLASESTLQVSVIDEKLRDKLVTEFQHMRNHATGPLACFLDYITYGYMIQHCSSDHRHTASETNIRAGGQVSSLGQL